jgi:hypothetical protein
MESNESRVALALLMSVACGSVISGCKDDPPKPVPAPSALTSSTAAAPSTATAAQSGSVAALPPPLLDAAKAAANRERLEVLVPKVGELPAPCKVKAVKDDAPEWLANNPHIDSNPAFVTGFVKAALPGADARQIESGLYLVYEEPSKAGTASQVGLFVFVFRSADSAAFGKKVFAQSLSAKPERFAVMQRAELLLVQWRDGEPGPCWDALRAWTLKQTKR